MPLDAPGRDVGPRQIAVARLDRTRDLLGLSRIAIEDDQAVAGGRACPLDQGMLPRRRRQIVSISSSDEGFYSDSDCGTWSRQGSGFSVSKGAVSSPATDSGTIDRNRQMYRARSGLR